MSPIQADSDPAAGASESVCTPTSTTPPMIAVRPSALRRLIGSPRITSAISAADSGRVPGISTEACATGARVKPV